MVRRKSISGGVFTALSDRILLDYGVVYRAAFDENLRLCHIRAQTKEQRDWQRESKYIQNDTTSIFRWVEKDLISGAKVLFTGCSCQVDALKRYLSLRPSLKPTTERLYLLDILCSGVSSPQLFEDYIAFVQRRKKKLRKSTTEDIFRHNHCQPISEKKEASRTFYRVCMEQGIEAVLTQYSQLNYLGRMKSLFSA